LKLSVLQFKPYWGDNAVENFLSICRRSQISLFSAALSAWGIFLSQSAFAEAPSQNQIFDLLNKCLHIPSNRVDGVAGAWESARFSFSPLEPDDAEKLNGWTWKGAISFTVPVRNDPNSGWVLGSYSIKVKGGGDEVFFYDSESSKDTQYDIMTMFLDCDFQKGVRVKSKN
jgi:hypothetical protein